MALFYEDKKIQGVYIGTQNTNCLTHIPNDINLELDSLNVSITGSPSVDNGVVSGFSSANYIATNSNFNPGGKTWEWQFKINRPSIANALIFGGKSYKIPMIGTSGSKFRLYLSGNGTSWSITSGTSGTHTVVADTDYWVRLRFTGSAYILSYSTDGSTFTDDITVSSTVQQVGGVPVYMGYGWNDTPMTNGSIDLSACYIKVGDDVVWQGGTGKLTLKKGSKVYVPNGWTNYKYYKYTYANWTQPTLSANGTMGGSSFAVTSDSASSGYEAYKAFDNDTNSFFQLVGNAAGQSLVFYNPNPLIVTKLVFTFYDNGETYSIRQGTLYGSDNNAVWTEIKSFASYTTEWSVADNKKAYKYYKIKVTQGGTYNGFVDIKNLQITAQVQTGGTESISSDYDYKIGSGNLIVDEVIISDDLSNFSLYAKQDCVITNGSNLFCSSSHFSGSNEPIALITGCIWYDTTNNIVKRYSGSNWEEGFAVVGVLNPNTIEDNVIVSEIQTFNGFGYIGGHKFRTKGIKFLSANGVNTDGSYKSIEIETNNFVVKESNTENENKWFDLLTQDAWFQNTKYYIQNTSPIVNTNAYWYNPNENKLYRWNGSEWQQINGVICCKSVSANKKVNSLTINPVQPLMTGREISRIYKGSSLVYGYKPNQVLLEESTAGTYALNIKYGGDYEVTIVGGGGGGAYNVSTKFSDGVISGGSGAGFQGIIYLKAGTYIVKVGVGGESVNPGNASTAMPKVGSDSSIANIITAGCANADGTANAGFGGSNNVISKGGVLTYDSDAIRSYTIATNGNDGLQGWNTSVEGASSVISGTTYGAGDKGQNGAMSKGQDGYVKIVAI